VNTQDFDQLRANIQTYAKQHGVEAALWRDDMPPRIHLDVFRRMEGRPATSHPPTSHPCDAADLRARLESDITVAARALANPAA
jgi:hypothetical protein